MVCRSTEAMAVASSSEGVMITMGKSVAAVVAANVNGKGQLSYTWHQIEYFTWIISFKPYLTL